MLVLGQGAGVARPGVVAARSEPTHYWLGAKGWVTVKPTSKTPLHVLRFLVDESYRAVAPKRVVASLPQPPKLFQ